MSANSDSPPPRRVFAYIDGFNLYHRRLKSAPELKWLCLRTLLQRLFPRDQIARVKFFTAKVDPASTDSPKQQRQRLYWEALVATGVEVIEGRFEVRDRQCGAQHCSLKASYRQMSEKMTDVNLALHIYRDFMEHQPDIICVISGDSDILPALRMVREAKLAKVMLVVCLPSEGDDLRFARLPHHYQIARTSRIGENILQHSQLPEKIEVSPGIWRHRPPSWRKG